MRSSGFVIPWLIAFSCNVVSASPELSNDENLALGISFGRLLKTQIEHQEIESGIKFDLPTVLRGLEEGLTHSDSAISDVELESLLTAIDQKVRRGAEEKHSRAIQANILAGEPRVQALLTDESAEQLESGVVFVNTEPALERVSPSSPEDTVTLKYRMETATGIVLDDTYESHKPSKFVISGLLKGIQQVIVNAEFGGQYVAILPPDLVYGDDSQLVEPGTYIVFKFDLLAIN
ncbi:hypothetical protein JCM19233_113 [Vibrio astriarenae]|nr:hypothetical protein JCM19233_113 [Vibrio sp. C7]